MKTCPNCNSKYLKCPECGQVYEHGKKSRCGNEACIEMNTPLDCSRCGLVASDDLKGILNFDMELIPYEAQP